MSSSVSSAVAEARTRLLNHFSQYSDDPSSGWSPLWDSGDFLPWDKGFPNPALIDVLTQRHDLLGSPQDTNTSPARRKTALVPGCGRGVDVLLLSSFGYDAYGLEISSSAIRFALEFQATHSSSPEYTTKDPSISHGTTNFLVGDFFKSPSTWTLQSPSTSPIPETFDLIYDYTFFSALPPSLRSKWSLSISNLLSPSPMGNLICVEFPTYKDPKSGGPPYATPSKAYIEYLSHPGEEIKLGEDGHVLTQPSWEVSEGGLQRVAHWKPERTHQVGMDEEGRVRDMVSVWRKI